MSGKGGVFEGKGGGSRGSLIVGGKRGFWGVRKLRCGFWMVEGGK